MELHIQQAYRSHINQKSFDNPRNFSVDLPAYHEIYNNDRSISVIFDPTSLPSYEHAVNWSIQRAETSVPIPDETFTIESAPHQPQQLLQKNCCFTQSKKKYCICLIFWVFITLVIFCMMVIYLF